MTITAANLIGSKPSNLGDATFSAINPLTAEELEPTFANATLDEVHNACLAAEKAFTPYRSLTPVQRASFLDAIADEIIALDNTLVQRAMLETGLPEPRIIGERGRTVGQLKAFARLIEDGSWLDVRIDTAQPDRAPVPKPDLRRTRIPLGPVAVFGASNFPLAFSVAGGDTAAALAAGCPVVVKAHPAHPGTSQLVAQAMLTAAEKTNMPEGVFSLLHGTTHEVGKKMVSHHSIKAVGFTGSLRGGRALFDLAAARPEPIPVFAEMGSCNPVFILPGAVAERADAIAEGLAGSVTLGAGQFCTNPGLTILDQSEESTALVAATARLLDESAAGTAVHHTIKDAYDASLAAAANTENVATLAHSDNPGAHESTSVHPAILQTDGDNYMNAETLKHEIFGPSTLVVRCNDKQQTLDVARQLEGHLTATIHGNEDDLAEYAELIQILETKVGRIIFNGYPTGVEVCPSMYHGGPYPASSDARETSVGTGAITRFTRPVCYQDFPQANLPVELQDGNPSQIWRLVNGNLEK